MAQKVLRVGLDMDGVILYNPVRIVRPIIKFIKKNILKKTELKLFYPKTKGQQLLWAFLHKTSLFIAPGVEDLKKLATQNKLELYIVTGRYEALEKDVQYWFNKLGAQHYFKGYYYNKDSEQPHLFKEDMIKKLKLDIFVEDNWDIVQHINQSQKNASQKTRVFWIYNILDSRIDYPFKFPTLKKVAEKIIHEL